MSKKKERRVRKIRGLGQAVKIDTDTWEYEDHTYYDVTITQDRDKFNVDVFDASIKDNNQAHIASDIFDSIEEAEQWIDEMCSIKTVWVVVSIFQGVLDETLIYEGKEKAEAAISVLAKEHNLTKESADYWKSSKMDVYLRETNTI